MRILCADLTGRLPELHHIDLDRVAIRVCQTRARGTHGIHASLTPLRFENGERTTVRRGRTWAIEPVCDFAGREMLYLLSFYLPRFCNAPFIEKLTTVVHELWHVGPNFDGDLRRFPGRCFAHGRREAEFHRATSEQARAWLALAPPRELYSFLEYDFRGLRRRFGRVLGLALPTPKLVPVSRTAEERAS
jgi:predicted metallopeptidase